MVEVEIPRGILSTVLVLVLTLGVGLLGWWVSPRDAQGRPMLLSPRVASMRRYYRLSRAWYREIAQVHHDLVSLLQEDQGSLLVQTKRLDGVFLTIGQVYQAWKKTPPPPALDALARQVEKTVLAYRKAAQATSEYLSRPGDDTRAQALKALQTAKTELDALGEMTDARR